MRFERGFTLTELAIAFVIIALLLASFVYTLSAQVEQRNFQETRDRLNSARDVLLSYAIVAGRLPCPAAPGTTGIESPIGGGTCTNPYNGFLPAITIGYQQVDSNGYALDSYGNRIRYAVAATNTGCTTTPPAGTPLFTNTTNLKTFGISCSPSDLVICNSSTLITATGCDPAGGRSVTNLDIVVAIIFSTGKNFPTAPNAAAAIAAGRPDEAANLDGNASFVFHTLAPAGAANGEFDDYLVWVTVGELYSRLIAAGVLP